jgi:hypothetical protein
MATNHLAPSRLSAFELLADLPAEEIAALESALEERRLPKGKDVFREGEKARYVYFLLAGKISIWYRHRDEEEQVRVLEAGELFGEEAILGAGIRNASAFVEEDATVLRISHPALRERLRGLPVTAGVLRSAARGRRLVRGRSFSWLTPDETVYLATRKTNFLLIPQLALPVLLGLLSIAGIFIIRREGWPDFAYLIAGAGLLIALAYGAWSALDWSNDFYLVTNRRVVALRRVPLIYDDRQEAPLDMIQSVATESTVNQRAFGFGDVIVRTYTRPITFQSIPDPKAAMRLIETIWKRRQIHEEQDDREEITRLIASRINKKESGEASLEETEVPAAAAAGSTASAVPATALGGMQTRTEQGGVVTYRKHRFFLLRNMFLPALLMLCAVPLSVVVMSGVLPLDAVIGICLVAGVFIAGAGWSTYEYLDWANDLYQVTPEQILALHRKPLGDEERRAAALENILSLEYDRPSLLARLFNFGTVRASVGQVNFTFEEVGDPVHVQEDIFRRLEAKKRRAANSQRRQRREEIADWIETYHNLTRPDADGAEVKESE